MLGDERAVAENPMRDDVQEHADSVSVGGFHERPEVVGCPERGVDPVRPDGGVDRPERRRNGPSPAVPCQPQARDPEAGKVGKPFGERPERSAPTAVPEPAGEVKPRGLTS